MNFWQTLAKPWFALAPMDDVSDVVFRRTLLRAGEIARRDFANVGQNFAQNPTLRPDIFFTEFTNAASFCSEKGKISTRGRLTFTPDENPIVAQIWGTNPDNFREMTAAMFAQGFAGVDINMGCPDKTVVKNGAGSGLIDNPDLAIELIRAAKLGAADFARTRDRVVPTATEKSKQNSQVDSAAALRSAQNDEFENFAKNSTANISDFPISVKTRLGAHKVDEFREWLPKLFREHPDNLTIHLRTRKEMSKVPAHFELIPEILQMRNKISPQTFLTINGDIISRKQAAEIREKYVYHDEKTGEISRVDGFMVGRGVFANPFCFANIENPTREELFELLNYHLDQFDEFREITLDDSRKSARNPQDESVNDANYDKVFARRFDPLKHFFKIYVNGFDGAKELREQMMAAKTTAEVREILKTFRENSFR